LWLRREEVLVGDLHMVLVYCTVHHFMMGDTLRSLDALVFSILVYWLLVNYFIVATAVAEQAEQCFV
jgi:hypothetical protein